MTTSFNICQIQQFKRQKIFWNLQEVRASFDREKNPNYHFETPYVVHLQNRTELAQPQPLFTFDHPCWDEKIENTRYQ